MKKFFYLVKFRYVVKNKILSQLDLGVFSTRKNAEKKILLSKNQPGFCEHSTNCFQIIKFAVDFNYEVADKSKEKLYCVCHEYEVEDNNENVIWNIFDYFSELELAKKKIEYLKKHSNIGKKYPNNFDIVEINVDNYSAWSSGFVSVI